MEKAERGFIMVVFRNTVAAICVRPFIILFTGILVFGYCLVDYILSPLKVFFTMGLNNEDNILDSLMHFIQLIFNQLSDINTLFRVAGCYFGSLIPASIFIGIILSGCLYIINNAVNRKPRKKREFLAGVKKYFFKISVISFKTLLISTLFIIFMLVASVPAIVITKAAASGKSELAAAATFINVLTFAVLFFGCMFFRTHIFFWFPAAINYKKRPFREGKRLVDAHFWGMVGRLIIFDIIFIMSEYIFISSNQSFLLFIANWIFKTVFLAFFITYIFSLFNNKVSAKKYRA